MCIRDSVKTPDINLKKVTIGKEEQQWADDALKHTFFVHKGYQPSYNYGEDINWQYWPVKDNELRDVYKRQEQKRVHYPLSSPNLNNHICSECDCKGSSLR